MREKILVQASKKFIVVVDESKISNKLGEKWAVPIEVVKFAYPVIEKYIESINGKPDIKNDMRMELLLLLMKVII